MNAKFCAKCGHNLSLHHHPIVAAGRPCSLWDCPCNGFERQLAIHTPTEAEKRAEARLIAERLMEVARA